MSEDLCYLSAVDLGALLRRREVSCLEVTRATLGRIEDLNPKLNAFITVAAEEALASARRYDTELATGRYRGPLHGIPVAIKDLYDTKGLRTTSGSKILAGRVPDEDATVVHKLKEAGVVIVGKTNLSEFACGVTTANPHYGDTRNPWDLTRTPGGSSGGSAAALAAGLCTLATGTDTGGSIRIPAALCGLVGLKPSFGRISTHGIMPLAWELDHPGPMGRTVRDTALMLEVMAGWDAADPATVRQSVPAYASTLNDAIRGFKIGVDRGYALGSVSTEVRSAFEQALTTLVDLGAEVLDVHVPGLEEGYDVALTVFRAEAAAIHEDWLRTRPADYDPAVRSRLEEGLLTTGRDYARALRARRQILRDLEAAFEHVHVLATPACAVTAPPIGTGSVSVDGQQFHVVAALSRFTRVFNLTGLPAIAVPCGFAGGLPIGLQLVGATLDERAPLQVALAYEQARDRWRPPPLS